MITSFIKLTNDICLILSPGINSVDLKSMEFDSIFKRISPSCVHGVGVDFLADKGSCLYIDDLLQVPHVSPVFELHPSLVVAGVVVVQPVLKTGKKCQL